MDFVNNEGDNLDEAFNEISEVQSQVRHANNVGMPPQIQILSHFRQELERRHRLCSVVLLCYIVHALHMLQMMSHHMHVPISDENEQRERRRLHLMRQLAHTEKCRDIIQMGPEAFMLLVHKLRGIEIVKDTIRSTVEEQVAKFLHVIGHNVKNRTVSFFFHRSGETVSRHFHNVLRAVISLHDEFLVQPSGRDVPPLILNNSRFYPFFKDCIGAIDGTRMWTHIRVKVPREEAPRFRGRKCSDLYSISHKSEALCLKSVPNNAFAFTIFSMNSGKASEVLKLYKL
ncbi:uncharacterized protein LOC130728726 [Lotus japonicus]|uniref:uncharacterized protein LOC130728726 n=1 Tax=Lotus japonicus TaxID=34305 RepID=UPI0025846BC0|nr:uncharacterized protein LOC130728726 [Lotus japonicus]